MVSASELKLTFDPPTERKDVDILTAVFDLLVSCQYHPVLESIGLGLESPWFDLIVTTRCN